MKYKLFVLSIAAVLVFLSSAAIAEKEDGAAKQEVKKEAVNAGNKICPISKQPVGSMGPAIPVEHEGKVYNLCCAGCVSAFKDDPEKFVEVVEEELKDAGQEALDE